MQIDNIQIKNFRAISELEVHFSTLTKLVGANNAGKSTVLSAIELFFDPAPKLTELDHHKREVSNPISITMEFKDFTPSEKEEFSTAIIDDRLRITRELSCANADLNNYAVTARVNPDFDAVRPLSGREKQAAYKTLMASYSDLPAARSAAEVDQAMNEWELRNSEALSITKVRGFFGATNVAVGKLAKKTSVRLIPAVKEVASEVRDVKKSPIILLLSDIARQSIENREELTRAIEEASTKIGALIDPSQYPQLANISEELTGALTQYYKNCRIEADWISGSPLSFVSPTPRIQVESAGIRTPIENVGHGLQRAVLFSLIEYLARQALKSAADDGRFAEPASDIILLIEEPEIFQHPSKQLTIARSLERLCEGFNDQTGIRIQVVITTHSEKFVDISKFENVRIIRRIGDEKDFNSVCRMCRMTEVIEELGAAREERAPLLSETQFASKLHIFTREVSEGFFADKVVLVEGVADKAAIHGAFAVHKRNPETEGIAIIDVGGKTNIDKPWVVFRRLGIPTYVVFDNDAGKKEGNRKPNYNRFLQKLSGASTCEDFPEGISSGYAALKGDLERCLRDALGDKWERIYAEICDEFGVERGDICKSPAVVRAVFSRGVAEGADFRIFQEIVRAVDEMR
jgi:putative ATP-dependent endonuclease of the OLD family